jgi:hypothetical protein
MADGGSMRALCRQAGREQRRDHPGFLHLAFLSFVNQCE